jgi:4-amino-4-deoxy-L-arabinose transferase-like glycosyltransferase
MHTQGVWITPLLEGKPWLEKPPLYYWITIPLLSIFSHSETTARICPVLFTLITAWAVFWLGTQLWTRLAGMLGASIFLTSLGIAGFGRSASTDMPFIGCFTAAMALLGFAILKKASVWKAICAYVFLGLAFLAKGPIAVVLAVGIGLLFWLLDERRISIRRWLILPGILSTAVVALPWFWLVFKQNGFSFISVFFINHNLARYITSIHHHSQPFYYYLPVLLVLFFPWSGWLCSLIPSKPVLKKFLRWREWNPSGVFLVCWFIFPIILFSLSDSKLAGYILPSLPPVALLLGVRLSQWIEGTVEPARMRPAIITHFIFSAMVAVAAPIIFQKEYGGNWQAGMILSIVILIPAIAVLIFGLKLRLNRALIATCLQGWLIVIATAQFAFPVLGNYHSAREIAHQALQARQGGEPIATFFYFHHSFHYYTQYQVSQNFEDMETMRLFTKKHGHFLLVADSHLFSLLAKVECFTFTLLGKQGDIRLARISLRSPNQ